MRWFWPAQRHSHTPTWECVEELISSMRAYVRAGGPGVRGGMCLNINAEWFRRCSFLSPLPDCYIAKYHWFCYYTHQRTHTGWNFSDKHPSEYVCMSLVRNTVSNVVSSDRCPRLTVSLHKMLNQALLSQEPSPVSMQCDVISIGNGKVGYTYIFEPLDKHLVLDMLPTKVICQRRECGIGMMKSKTLFCV